MFAAAPLNASSSLSSESPLSEEEKLEYIKVSAFVDSVKNHEIKSVSSVPVLASMTNDSCGAVSTEPTNDRVLTDSCCGGSGGESSKKRSKRARSTEKNGIDEQAIREHVHKRSKKNDTSTTRASDGNGGKKPSKREATEDAQGTCSSRVTTEITYSPSSPDYSPHSSVGHHDVATGGQPTPSKKSKSSASKSKRAAADSTGVAEHDPSSSKASVGAERAGATVSKATVHTTTPVVQDNRKKNAVSQTDEDDQVSPNAAAKKSGGGSGQSAVKSVASGTANGTSQTTVAVKRKLSPTVADDSLFPDFEIIDPRIVEPSADSIDQPKKSSKSKRVTPVSLLRLELRSTVNRMFSPNEACSLFANVYQKQPHLLSGVDIHVYGENGLSVAYGNSLFDSRGFSVVLRNYGTANSIKIGQVIGYLELRSMVDKVKIY